MIINKDLLEDVKIYSSSEQRVTATADIFIRSFLHLSEVPENSIQVSKEMLDDSNAVKEQTENVKSRLQEILDPEREGTLPLDIGLPEPVDPAVYVQDIIDILRILRVRMRENYENLDVESIQRRWCCSETPMLFKVSGHEFFLVGIGVEIEQIVGTMGEAYERLLRCRPMCLRALEGL